MKYMIKLYLKSGKLHSVKYANTLNNAIKIREKWILKNKIEKYAFFPTIWEKSNNEYIRIEGF